MKSFRESVLNIVCSIPRGKVLTYFNVAALAGNACASRAVGAIMAANKNKKIPCHRVVRSDGSVGGYNYLKGKSKINLLKKEGVLFNKNNKIIFR